MSKSGFKGDEILPLKRWPTILATVLFLLLLSSWPVHAGQDISFAVISDHRSYLQALETVLKFIDSQNVDFILVPGDFDPIEQAYSNYYSIHGYAVGPEHQPERQEIYYVLGNHDNPPSGEDFFHNDIALYYPNNGPGLAPMGTVFSFDWGDCHFTVTNQYWNYPTGGYTEEQLEWIEQDLAASSQPYKFVIGHEPAFPQHSHVGDSLDADPSMRDAFWQILVEEGAQAYFCSHTHFLSVVLRDGVYQLDAGETQDDHICVMIAEVNPNTVTIHSYETEGSMPTAGDEIDTVVLQSGSHNNDPPTADAGPDQTVYEGVIVTLDGSSSSDPDDGIASYLWEQTDGTSVVLSDPSEVEPTFTAPYVGPDGESLTFQLTVTDTGGLQSTDTCTVHVTDTGENDHVTIMVSCFIATAGYGSWMAEQVVALKKFRDTVLLKNPVGRAFIKFSGTASSPLASYTRSHEISRTVTGLVLPPIVLGVNYPKASVFIFLSSVSAITLTLRARRSNRF
ncbi:MAG: metallophosphoesterase [Deltaproteobacteria bacterium]|nr:MAG: metallophosphoesterase [Deltaproteobacteria bacterium]